MASPAPPASTQPSAQAPASVPAPSASSAVVAAAPAEQIPSVTTLVQAARLSIQQDKPLQLDYFNDTANLKAFIGEDPETKEKVLVKNREEFTSLISKTYKVAEDFLIMTENSIYIVSGKIQKRKINLASLQGDE